jgi:WD40 repeat protein
MISGHRDGSICIWDLKDYKLIKYIPNLHESEVTAATILSSSTSSIKVISCEDNGAVRLTDLNKKPIFGGYSVHTEPLYKNKMRGTTILK